MTNTDIVERLKRELALVLNIGLEEGDYTLTLLQDSINEIEKLLVENADLKAEIDGMRSAIAQFDALNEEIVRLRALVDWRPGRELVAQPMD